MKEIEVISGEIEIDECYFWSKKNSRQRRRGAAEKYQFLDY